MELEPEGFGNGVLGDMGSHLIDLPYWALELKRPSNVKSEGPDADRVAAPFADSYLAPP